MIDRNNTQYCIMSDEQKNDAGAYIPNYAELIANAPNAEMKTEWENCKKLHENIGKKEPRFSGFAFNGIYMMKMACGHYEIFQHPVRDESDLIEWIELMTVEEKNRKCTLCICS